jgi:AcrR family transcriptional regulator
MDDQGPAPSKPTPARVPELDPLHAAVLTAAGELGYRRVDAEQIAARAARPVSHLYAHYSGVEECFASAYELIVEPLAGAMLDAAPEHEDLAGCLATALTTLFAFVDAEPLLARATLAEVYVAGGAARARHEQILRRLSDAVAGTRRESKPSRHDPPPLTAAFIVGGIEEVVRRRVGERRPDLLWDELPGLVAFATARLKDDGPAGE